MKNKTWIGFVLEGDDQPRCGSDGHQCIEYTSRRGFMRVLKNRVALYKHAVVPYYGRNLVRVNVYNDRGFDDDDVVAVYDYAFIDNIMARDPYKRTK